MNDHDPRPLYKQQHGDRYQIDPTLRGASHSPIRTFRTIAWRRNLGAPDEFAIDTHQEKPDRTVAQ
jgi:hypothetical protein